MNSTRTRSQLCTVTPISSFVQCSDFISAIAFVTHHICFNQWTDTCGIYHWRVLFIYKVLYIYKTCKRAWHEDGLSELISKLEVTSKHTNLHLIINRWVNLSPTRGGEKIVRLTYQCLWIGRKWLGGAIEVTFHFPCCPLISDVRERKLR